MDIIINTNELVNSISPAIEIAVNNALKGLSERKSFYPVKVITKGTARKILDLNNSTFEKYKDFELIPVLPIENKITGKFFAGYDENIIIKIKPVIDQIKRTRESLEKYENAKKEIDKILS